ncbi:hypothetical protein P4639_21920 [Priestia megaterium]|uniref:hypothetical protein n=1 Tax=Priestia megaterium TaxID=1404 RepID=UPI002E1EC3B9|nr:hypothetical protein [Priestia megaterium]
MAVNTDLSKEMREILLKAEVKRLSERISKAEICSIYGFNYNFYLNCCSGRNAPSRVMGDALSEYLETETSEVYRKIFEKREIENTLHKKTKLTPRELVDKFKEYKEQGFFHLTEEEAESVLYSFANNVAELGEVEVDMNEVEELQKELKNM